MLTRIPAPPPSRKATTNPFRKKDLGRKSVLGPTSFSSRPARTNQYRADCPTGSTCCSPPSVHPTLSGGKTRRYWPGGSAKPLIRPRTLPVHETATLEPSTEQEIRL